MVTSRQYRQDLDVIKGLSIIAVVLFHLGIVKSGYLGVDVFFVVNGFLIVPSLLQKIESGSFSYLDFIKKRMMRLAPMVVLVTLICLVVGYFVMLPDDYENLGQAVVASHLYSENILLYLTTRDYWNVSNDYNPLMHLWYVGIIVEFYFVFPLLVLAWNRLARYANRIGGGNSCSLHFLMGLGVVSYILYFGPFGSESGKFYFLQYRFFEFLLGGVVGILVGNCISKKGYSSKLYYIIFALLICIVFINIVALDIHAIGTDVRKIGGGNEIYETGLILPKQLLLTLTVVLSAVFVYLGSKSKGISNRWLEFVGKRSYSIFIWHQGMIAFYRYLWSTEITWAFIIVFFVMLFVLSELTYRLIEKRFVNFRHSILVTISMTLALLIAGGYVYVKAGVVRDVPELNIYKDYTHRGMHAEYVDRVYGYDKDFSQDANKRKVLVQGNSYGRDMANVLLESSYKDSIDISYIFSWDSIYIDRIRQADYIFTFGRKSEVPDYAWTNIKASAKVVGIGTKNFGHSNGVIYTNRFSPDYYKQSVELHSWYKQTNESWKKDWGENYVDFIQLALTDSNRVRLFTDDGKYISQDCYHLTPAGAKWFAKEIDFKKIFE